VSPSPGSAIPRGLPPRLYFRGTLGVKLLYKISTPENFYNVLRGEGVDFNPPNNPTDIINNIKKNDRQRFFARKSHTAISMLQLLRHALPLPDFSFLLSFSSPFQPFPSPANRKAPLNPTIGPVGRCKLFSVGPEEP